MTSRLLTVLVVLALCIAGYALINRAERGADSPASSAAQAQDPGYMSRDAEIIETGPDGRPIYTLKASIIRQLPNADRVTLENVYLEMRDTGGNTWIAHADEGQILADAAHIHLAGDVQVEGKLPGAAQPAQITTDQLAFDTRQEIVSTRSPVTLDWAGRKLQARGLVANLKDHRLQLESSVHGIFPQ